MGIEYCAHTESGSRCRVRSRDKSSGRVIFCAGHFPAVINLLGSPCLFSEPCRIKLHMAMDRPRDVKHEILQDLKRVAADLGEAPTQLQYHRQNLGVFTEWEVKKYFGGFTVALTAAGLTPSRSPTKDVKFKYIVSKLHSFNIHTIDLDTLFNQAGQPEVLKLVCQPDTHVPFHDTKAISVFLQFLKYYRPHVHMIMGDFLDCNGISHWPAQDTKVRRLIPEAVEGEKLIREIIKHTPDCNERIYLEGNHEDWITQAKAAQMPQLFDGIDEHYPGLDPNLENLLKLKEHGYKLFKMNDIVRIGHANFTHGLYTSRSHAQTHLSNLKDNIYYGHLHDTQSANDVGINGPMEAQSLGCLCQLDAKFLKGKPNNWVHAFGVFEFFRDGSYTFYCPKIIRGKLGYNGKLFTAK